MKISGDFYRPRRMNLNVFGDLLILIRPPASRQEYPLEYIKIQ